MYSVAFSLEALSDLDNIFDYLLENADLETAKRKIREIKTHCIKNLSDFPQMFQRCEEAGNNIRKSALPPYNIYYLFNGKSVQVIHIVRHSQDIGKAF